MDEFSPNLTHRLPGNTKSPTPTRPDAIGVDQAAADDTSDRVRAALDDPDAVRAALQHRREARALDGAWPAGTRLRVAMVDVLRAAEGYLFPLV